MEETRPIILKTIDLPFLRNGIPPQAFTKLCLLGGGLFLGQLYILGILVTVGLYVYYFRKTQKNPFFMDEAAAHKIHRKTQNIHPVKGNYYSA